MYTDLNHSHSPPRGEPAAGRMRRTVVWIVEGVLRRTVPTDQPVFRGVAPPRPEPGQTQPKPLISHRLGAALLFGVVKGGTGEGLAVPLYSTPSTITTRPHQSERS